MMWWLATGAVMRQRSKQRGAVEVDMPDERDVRWHSWDTWVEAVYELYRAPCEWACGRAVCTVIGMHDVTVWSPDDRLRDQISCHSPAVHVTDAPR